MQSGDEKQEKLHEQAMEPAAEPAEANPTAAAPDPTEATRVQPPAKPAKSALRETLETVLVALLLAFFIRTFLVQQYVVDGASMYPTLHDGDRLLVNKLVYRFRTPQAGDVIVLADKSTPGRQLIKRVVAVAGETIAVQDQQVLVNGQPLQEDYTNPNTPRYGDVGQVTVPPGQIYVMGDNRGGSLDSRTLGPIEISQVQGKASFLFWPFDRARQHGPLEAARTYIP